MQQVEELNVLLTRTGPGTASGDLLRRYWQPVRVMSEDLVLYRDETGQPGLLGLHCPHRGTDLSYGRIEDGGLRCLYHGWLFDRAGRCLEQPGEPAGSTFHQRVRHQAYPCVERAGLVFAYLGPGEPPLVPRYEFLQAPIGHVLATKAWQECNYLQANEGNLDGSHLAFLHVVSARYRHGIMPPDAPLPGRGEAPGVETADLELAPFGLRCAKVRRAPGGDHQEIFSVDFILPNLTAFYVGPAGDTSGRRGYSVHWHVPVDDTTHWKYLIRFSRDEPFPPGQPPWRYETRDYRPVHTRADRYGQDRARMRADTYSGLAPDFHQHDQWATESQGPIADLRREHLGALDLPIVVARKLLVKAIEDVRQGRDPQGVVRNAAQNRFRIVSCNAPVPAGQSWKDYCRELESHVRVEASAEA
jgi:phenylpropionate dioxygenase-like ring-hydroxylating dioxygenase large terminal subunit